MRCGLSRETWLRSAAEVCRYNGRLQLNLDKLRRAGGE